MNIHNLGQIIASMLANLDFIVKVRLKPEHSCLGRLVVHPLEFQVVDFILEKNRNSAILKLAKKIPIAPLGIVKLEGELDSEDVYIELHYDLSTHNLVKVENCSKNFRYISELKVCSSISYELES